MRKTLILDYNENTLTIKVGASKGGVVTFTVERGNVSIPCEMGGVIRQAIERFVQEQDAPAPTCESQRPIEPAALGRLNPY